MNSKGIHHVCSSSEKTHRRLMHFMIAHLVRTCCLSDLWCATCAALRRRDSERPRRHFADISKPPRGRAAMLCYATRSFPSRSDDIGAYD